jgi:hypothetical protein
MVITAKNIGHFVIAFSLFQISCGNNDSNSTHVTIPESETNQYQSDTVGAAKNQNPEVLNIEEHIRYRKKWYREQGNPYDSLVLDTSTGDVITVDIKIQEGKLYYKKTRIVGGTQKAWFSEMESNLKKKGALGVSGGRDHTIYNYIVIVEGVITITDKTEFGDITHPTYYIQLNSGSIKSITKINELWMGNDGTKISGDDKMIFDESRDCSGCDFILSNRENTWALKGHDVGNE